MSVTYDALKRVERAKLAQDAAGNTPLLLPKPEGPVPFKLTAYQQGTIDSWRLPACLFAIAIFSGAGLYLLRREVERPAAKAQPASDGNADLGLTVEQSALHAGAVHTPATDDTELRRDVPRSEPAASAGASVRLTKGQPDRLPSQVLVSSASPTNESAPSGRIVLQVTAVARETSANSLADDLRKKGFFVLVVAPATDNLYRVHVGPYADRRTAGIAALALQREGLESFVRIQ